MAKHEETHHTSTKVTSEVTSPKKPTTRDDPPPVEDTGPGEPPTITEKTLAEQAAGAAALASYPQHTSPGQTNPEMEDASGDGPEHKRK